jgi:hypothetical protein
LNQAEGNTTMPFYVTSPFKATPKLLIQGTPEYVFGSLNNNTGATLGTVISDSAATTTATIVFQIQSGNIPIPGALITVIGTANSAGIFNVTNATLLTVVVTAQGVATVTYAISSTTQASLADGGQVSIPQIEIGDNLTAGIVATLPATSVPVAAVIGATTIGRSTSATLTLPAASAAFPSTLSGVTAVIQGANVDRDDHYNTIGTLTTTGAAGNTYDWQSGQGEAATPAVLADGNVNVLSFRFYRIQITAATGAGYAVATIMQ